MAPAGLRSSTDAGAAAAVRRGAAAGRDAGAGVAEPPPSAFFIRWNMPGLAAAAGAGLVVLVATLVFPLHCALLALPALVQS